MRNAHFILVEDPEYKRLFGRVMSSMHGTHLRQIGCEVMGRGAEGLGVMADL
jgi:hypothetical protein